MPQRKQSAVERSRDILHGRSGYRLHANWGQVGVLEGGGHICELTLNCIPRINPLWQAPWTTIDPDSYATGRRSRTYGPPPDAKLLAGIAGHSLSFDHFERGNRCGARSTWGSAVGTMEDEEGLQHARSCAALQLRTSRGTDQL